MRQSLLKTGMLLVLGSAICRPQPSNITTGFPEPGGQISFGAFQEVNWQQKAQAALPWLNVEHPTPQQVEKLASQILPPGADPEGPPYASVPFTSRLDPGMTRSFYYFVSVKGIQRLELRSLAGDASYEFDNEHKDIKGTTIQGHVIARTPGVRFEDGGFVLFNEKAVAGFHWLPAPPSVLQRLPEKDKPEDVAKAFTFNFAGVNYLFVKWKGYVQDQRLFCSNEFSIYSIDGDVKELMQEGYNCDV